VGEDASHSDWHQHADDSYNNDVNQQGSSERTGDYDARCFGLRIQPIRLHVSPKSAGCLLLILLHLAAVAAQYFSIKARSVGVHIVLYNRVSGFFDP
jgi:hypothetical protein